jgi:hypothetical protein
MDSLLVIRHLQKCKRKLATLASVELELFNY